MSVALVQEFKIRNDDRTTTNYDHIVEKLDLGSNPPVGLITHTAGWDEQAGCSESLPSGTARTRRRHSCATS
jgi:hypothetical protein